MNARSRWIAVAAAAVLCLMGHLGASPLEAQIPEEFTNLEVLPEDISRGELVGTMRSFSMGLGVRCTHCHVGEEGQPFSEFDFASDEKPAKRKARFMLQMTQRLNGEILPGLSEVADRVDPPAEVQCVTCHRGVRVPRQIAEVLAIAVAEGGGEVAVTRYRELREEYHGSGSYDFGEQPLIEAAGSVAGDDPEAGLAIFDLALEYFPESVQALVGTAQIHMAGDDVDAAREALLRAQELAPDSPQIQRMLQRLDGGV